MKTILKAISELKGIETYVELFRDSPRMRHRFAECGKQCLCGRRGLRHAAYDGPKDEPTAFEEGIRMRGELPALKAVSRWSELRLGQRIRGMAAENPRGNRQD